MAPNLIRAADTLQYIEPGEGTSSAVTVGDVPLAHTTQLLPVDAAGTIVGKDRPAEQIDQLFKNVAAALAATRSRPENVVKYNVYVARPEIATQFRQKLAGLQDRERAGPALCFVAGRLPHPDALIALDAVAVADSRPLDAVRHLRAGQIQVSLMPAGAKVYVAGQAAKGKDVAEATRLTLQQLHETLQFLGLKDSDVVQAKSFLKPMADVGQAREEITKFFGADHVPALSFVQWTLSSPIEIELVVWGGKAKPGEPVEYITPTGMTASPVFSRVARINHGSSIYVSGLYGEGANATAEIESIFGSLDRILKKAGSDLRHMVKATYYVSTPDTDKQLNVLRPKFYDPKRPPSASKAGVPGVGREGRGVTLDMIAVPVSKR
jgi:enamine deaminase RidA (YjgF/YER057c/UK114 family)